MTNTHYNRTGWHVGLTCARECCRLSRTNLQVGLTSHKQFIYPSSRTVSSNNVGAALQLTERVKHLLVSSGCLISSSSQLVCRCLHSHFSVSEIDENSRAPRNTQRTLAKDGKPHAVAILPLQIVSSNWRTALLRQLR